MQNDKCAFPEKPSLGELLNQLKYATIIKKYLFYREFFDSFVKILCTYSVGQFVVASTYQVLQD